MVYDYDLKFAARMIVVLGLSNLASAIWAIVRRQWFLAAANLVWCGNIWYMWGANRNLQRQRDRNREIEAAVLKVLIPSRLDKIN